MLVAHAGAGAVQLGHGHWGSNRLRLTAMFGFQVLMGASSPGMYAMSQILAGPRASGRWVGIQNSIGNLLRGRLPPGSAGIMWIYRVISRLRSSPPSFVSALGDSRLDRHGAEARSSQVVGSARHRRIAGAGSVRPCVWGGRRL